MSFKVLILTLIFLLSGSVAIAQDFNVENGFENDEDFNVRTFPDKWKDESAIVLCQKYDFSYVRYGVSRIQLKEILRRRVFINDIKARDDFSVFYYAKMDAKKKNIGFKVLKPDGRVINVDLTDGVEVGVNEVSSTYNYFYFYYNYYMKIAIPNLEVGDIIDYYATGIITKNGSQEIEFEKFSFSLSREYPVLKQKFFFNVDKGFKVNCRSFNGAPEIQKTNKVGVNKRGKTRKDIKTYLIEDDSREKLKAEIWKYNSLEEPWIKFQVYYITKSLVKSSRNFIVTEKDLINTPLSEEFIIEKNIKSKRPNNSILSHIVQYTKKQSKLNDPEETADLIYYYFRYLYIKNVFTYDTIGYLDGLVGNINSIDFTNIFAKALTVLKVPYKYVIAADRGTGGFNNVILSDDVTSGIKVGENYYYYFSNFSTKEMLPSIIQGSDILEFKVDKKMQVTNLEHLNIPISDFNDNSFTSKITVDFNKSMDTTYIVHRDSLTGLIKPLFQQLVLHETDYLIEEKLIYDRAYIRMQAKNSGKSSKANKKKTKLSRDGHLKKDKKNRVEIQLIDELEKWRRDFINDFFEDDFVIGKVDSVKIISKGRMPGNTNLIVEEKFRVEELINKAGRNYIFKIGSLIGSQLELDENDMTRESDIRLSFQNKYSYNIEINIPEGYSVESVESLNYNVVNDIGEFTVVAKIVDNKIIINANKKYKKLFTPKEDWNKYIDFLEAAYEFSQKKIIIKKTK